LWFSVSYLGEVGRFRAHLLDNAGQKVDRRNHPNITVTLVGHDGNAFAILGRCKQAMRSAGLPPAEVELFMEEATSGNYDHLLQTCMRWLEIA
jgi:hypothetical protein